jgi:putative membrane protein insertion efficiency factor
MAGRPIRVLLLLAIRGYQATIGQGMVGRCRFYPTCSAYAAQAIAELGALRGCVLAIWRVLRCSPLSKGGVDHVPRRASLLYDNDIQRLDAGGADDRRRVL